MKNRTSPFFFLFLNIFCSSAFGITHTVTTSSDQLDTPAGAELSLREAIRDANSGDTIEFDAALNNGLCILTKGELSIDAKNLVIDASSLADGYRLLVGTSFLPERVFAISNSSIVTLDNLTMLDAVATTDGGAIHNSSSADTTINQCLFTGNTATDAGGAIYNTDANLTITNSTFTGNASLNGNGGAITSLGASSVVSVSNSTISDNETTLSGGGIYLSDALGATITDSQVSLNAANQGAGIYSAGSGITVTRSSVSGNIASNGGGGIYQESGSTLTFRNSTLAENIAKTGAGLLNKGTATFRFSTVSTNHADLRGGGIATDSTVNIINTIVANNTALVSPDIEKVAGSIGKTGVNFIGNNATVSTEFPAGLPNVNNDFVGDTASQADPLLAPLGYYGGSSPSMPPLAASSVIDAAGSTSFNFDQRQFTRTVGLAADIGAAEAPLAVTVTTAVDENDAALGLGLGDSLREILSQPLASGTRVLFDSSLSGVTMTQLLSHIELNGKHVFIDASDLALPPTIDGGGTNRLLYCHSGSTVSLHHINLSNGYDSSGVAAVNGGGAINTSDSSISLNKCVFTSNITENLKYGGAIFSIESQLTIHDCEFNSNSCENGTINLGGALYLIEGTTTIHNTIFDSNTSRTGGTSAGGAIYSDGSILSLKDSSLTNNFTAATGVSAKGGTIFSSGGSVTMSHSTISESLSLSTTGTSLGGAIYTTASPLFINQSTLYDNQAGSSADFSSGGAIYRTGAGEFELISSTVDNNLAGAEGGGIASTAASRDVTLRNSTISANFADNKGGGILIQGVGFSITTIENCIIATNNSVFTGQDIELATVSGIHTIVPIGANLIGNNSTVETEFPLGTLVGELGALADPMLSTIGSYGGSTQTKPLKAGSPAIDAAISLTTTPARDQRGSSRSVGTEADLGAHENGNDYNYAMWSIESIPAVDDSAFDVDLEPDGLDNGIEYALLLNPVVSDSSDFAVTSYDLASGLTVSFPFRTRSTDLIYILESSSDLITFTEVYRYVPSTQVETITGAGITSNVNSVQAEISVTDPNGAASLGFWQLRAELLP